MCSERARRDLNTIASCAVRGCEEVDSAYQRPATTVAIDRGRETECACILWQRKATSDEAESHFRIAGNHAESAVLSLVCHSSFLAVSCAGHSRSEDLRRRRRPA